MALYVPGCGPRNAEVMIVGEAPGFDEEMAGVPFIGASGFELQKMLREAGINKDDCYVTNVCKYRPPKNDMSAWLTDKKTDANPVVPLPPVGKRKEKKPGKGFVPFCGRYAHPLVIEGYEELIQEVKDVRPKIIIGFGNTALLALAGKYGVTNWRGSELRSLVEGIPFVPTIHPAAVLRNWSLRPQVVHDLKFRVKRRLDHGFIEPKYDFNIAPTFLDVVEFIEQGVKAGTLAADVETSHGHIVCLGLAYSANKAICIPMYNELGVYWKPDDLRDILLQLESASKKVFWVGQNWNYDAQYFEEDFGWTVMADHDTYIAESVLWPGGERGLGFLSSMYCDHHAYWKEDGKDWAKGIKDFAKEFNYNCRDVCATWEIATRQQQALTAHRMHEQFDERMRYSGYVYRMMRRGVNRDAKRTAAMVSEVNETIHEKELEVAAAAGRPVNFQSPKQVSQLLYKDMGLDPVGRKTKGGAASTDDDALTKLMEKNPNAAPICNAILEARSLASLRANFLEAEVDPDGKFRSSWMATGTETFRLTSGGNAFHRGGPLQNVTDGKHTNSGRPLPNLRSTIVPDSGYTLFNCDLERADLQVVAWEADDADLKAMLRHHEDVHTQNAADLFGIDRGKVTEQQRHTGKKFVHLTNYGGKERTCAIGCHITVHQAELLQRRWFEMHPGIKRWHDRTAAFLTGTRTVRNAFGYRRVYFDRVDGLLPEALAWVPQSTVSILISLMQMAIEDQCPVEIIMQGHDSIVGQYKTSSEVDVLPRIQAASIIAVPYSDPLYIPLELATSTSSWGEVEKRAWPTIT